LQVFYCRALLEQLAALQPQNGLHFVINAHLSFFFPLPSLWPESIFMLFPTVVGGQGSGVGLAKYLASAKALSA